jgi:hypothetical protein
MSLTRAQVDRRLALHGKGGRMLIGAKLAGTAAFA